ncbi:MAG TPA: hypothetical protein VII73_00065 [Caulobacteraceae bacterium]
MPRATTRSKADTFNLRLDRKLKAAFQAATEAHDKPAAQVLREFMRAYVERQHERVQEIEARRQSRLIAHSAADPGSDEAAVMRWMESAGDTRGWTA